MPALLQADREVVLVALAQTGQALQFAAQRCKTDRGVVLVVAQSGQALQFAASAQQADRKAVLAAVAQPGGEALTFAASALQADPEVVLAAVAHFCRSSRAADKPHHESGRANPRQSHTALRDENAALKAYKRSAQRDGTEAESARGVVHNLDAGGSHYFWCEAAREAPAYPRRQCKGRRRSSGGGARQGGEAPRGRSCGVRGGEGGQTRVEELTKERVECTVCMEEGSEQFKEVPPEGDKGLGAAAAGAPRTAGHS